MRTKSMKFLGAKLRIVTLARVYFVFLFGWAILHALFGDRWSLLFLLSSFAPYWFAPLPIIFAMAIVTRRREIWIGFVASIALGAWMYGGLFLPKSLPASPNDATLTVMTYNMLGLNNQPNTIVTTIRASNADLIAIQEFNPFAADAIRNELIEEYPYQILAPTWNVSGMGILSRYPIRATGETLPGEWVGSTQVVTIEWRETQIVILNVHPMPTNFGLSDYFFDADQVEWTIRERERDVQVIANFVAAQNKPVVVLGDFNLTDTSGAYQIITRSFTDAWREAGWGLGHTFPAPNSAGESRIAIAGIPLPTWLVRIDYVFHSHHWRAASAQIGQWDGVSDHRPVIAKLVLTHK